MSGHSYTPAGQGVEEVHGVDGGHGVGKVRAVSLDGMKADWQSLRFITLEPGASFGPRVLFSSEVIVYVTKGAATAFLPSRRARLDVGGCLALPVGAQLEVVNEGDCEVELVVAELGAH